ncbi:iron-containing alcohol dehydrogenase [Cohnella lubricantis]|uniref:Iron-containing alcohol dehydrogenase n=1 Tax=Cohnella lubricantis TaxID=2163172 RepID=A0A841TEI7_9BACL|nr:iron-containing alcohol dehydrogenase [Cohnella lubricantis]MBB6678399.1 iron-containing alcohol dehydrogenase [Cohnella lubricantis]MBP2116779.1 glycerol dehydrogenase-like iron-containing ADH family enzyme [Cohnella lubricantis]
MLVNHIETSYGRSILARELEKIGEYIVLTMEPAWTLGEPFFRSSPPAAVVNIDSLDQDKLDALYERLSAGTLREGVRVVGAGGGTVLDAAKYMAYLHGSVPVIIPSITSTNAPFSDYISIRRDGGPFGFKVDGYPKKVIVDPELIALAEPRFNRAGYGDLLYMQTALQDWELAHSRGVGEPPDPKIAGEIGALIQESIRDAAEIGAMSENGICKLMAYTQRSTELVTANSSMPIGAGAEHLFAWNMDLLCDRPLIHGEVVSLGIVIASYLQADYLQDSRWRELRSALDGAHVRYRPDELGVSWEDIEQALLTVEAYNQRVRGYHTVFEHIAWTPTLLERLKEYVYGS